MGGERPVAALTGDASMTAVASRFGDLSVAVETGRLPGVLHRPGPVVVEGTGPVVPERAEAWRHHERADGQEDHEAAGEECRDPNQVPDVVVSNGTHLPSVAVTETR
jgi:hypothetical protein